MNLEAIKVGDRIPNYKAFCRLLDEEVKSGASKRSQLKVWEQYFSYERDKNAYVITEIYDVPQIKEDGRMTFMKYSVPFLLHYFSVNKIAVQENTVTQWLTITDFTPEIILGDDLNEKYESPNGFSHLEIQSAKNHIYETSKNAFMSALSNLKKDDIIAVEKKMNIIFPNGRTIEGNEDDESYSKEVRERLYQEFGVESMFSIQMSKTRSEKFFKRMGEIYLEEKGWERTFNTITTEVLDWEIIEKYEGINEDEYKKELYKEYYKSILKKIRNQEDKTDFTDWETTKFQLTRMQAGGIWFILQEVLL
ncbi:MAG: hypothetical protein ACI4IW_08115 [Oscillospiraceae bacterium]